MVSGGYYAPDINGENRRLQFENNSYYDHMYNRGDFSSKGGFGGLNAAVWAGGYQYQVSSSGTLLSTNQNMNGLQLDTRNGNYGFWAESFSVENTQVPDGLKLADGSITLRTAVKKNVFVPLLGLSKLLNDNPFSSRVMRQSWENNRDNPMRDVGMMHMGVYPGPSPWMCDFNRAFGTMLNVGMAAGLAPIIAPTLFEHVSTKFLINGFLSSSVNAIGQYTLTGDVDLVDVVAAFVFNKPFGNSLFAYSFTAGLFDYSITNQTLRSPFLGNKDGIISAVEIICNLYMGRIGGQASKFTSNNFTKFGINTGFIGLGIYLFSNYSK